MNASDVPTCMRGSLLESRALEDGERAGRAGLGADVNPWLEKAARHKAILNGYIGVATVHAEGKQPWRAFCGLVCVWSAEHGFHAYGSKRCKSCVRAVEAERKRLARVWEQGRLSTHPK